MILDKIVNKKRNRILEEFGDNTPGNRFREKINNSEFFIIGEFKKASPSKGIIAESFDVEKILEIYENLSIDAYSVLTEEDYFLGNKEYLKNVVKKGTKPVLRKDFIIDPIQLVESKEIGADAVLLIVAILGDKLGEFYRLAKYLGLTALVEVHNKEELDIALKYDVEIIGINNRDLKTFNITLDTTKNLIKYIPDNKIVISESGVKNIGDLKYLKSLGVNGVLVGEAFMRNLDNNEFLNEVNNIK